MLKLALAILLLLPAAAAPVRIVCIGDSITQGRKGIGEHKPTQSYRYPLWKKLVDLGASVDFVGSLPGGFEGDPDWPEYKGKAFDREHEGHWGGPPAGFAKSCPSGSKATLPTSP